MDLMRLHYANQLSNVLDYQLQLISNSDECSDIYENFLGVNFDTANQLLLKIANEVPESFIRVQCSLSLQIQNDIIDQFILFMVQERGSSLKSFGQTFSDFIRLLIFEIAQNNDPTLIDKRYSH